MKPNSLKPATASAPSSSTSVKYELLSFRSAQPHQPIRFEFGPLKETFTLDLPTDAQDGTTKHETWRDWKRRAIEHSVVKRYFKATATSHYGEFALRLPGGASGEWIGPESLRDDEEADTKQLLRLAGATSTTTSILLVYAPIIHICTFDGIKFAACSFGHWLSASDSKTLERVKREENQENACPNDWLLKDSHQSDLARLLFRVALFMHDELKLEHDTYVISVPFGQYIFADGDSLGSEEIRARVQLTDTRIFWMLLLKFEEKLNDDERSQRLEYFVHQRQAWIDARSADYKRWAAQEAASVRVALENPIPPPTTQFKLPKNCSWDEYGRMQLCLKMFSPLCDMVGQMGAISSKLKTVVGAIQMAAALTGSSNAGSPVSINVSIRADQCLVLLPADRYMSVLTRANADPKTWGAALLDALRDAPDRLYSGLLYETSGLYQCSREDLVKLDECLKFLAPKLPGIKGGIAKVVDTSALPISADVIRSLESKNHTDKRLFLERALEVKAFGGVVLSVLGPSERSAISIPQPTIWEKKRAAAAPMSTSNSFPTRETTPPAWGDREDRQGEDFARFEGDASQSAPASSGPTPAQAAASVGVQRGIAPVTRTTLQRAGSDRQPPPTVSGAAGYDKALPPQVIGGGKARGPPRVQIDSGEIPHPPTVLGTRSVSGERPPPPQVKQAPPTVFGSLKPAENERPDRRAPQGTPGQARAQPDESEWRYKPQQMQPEDQTDFQRKYDTSVAIQMPDQGLDREDRGFETPFTSNGSGYRGTSRGGRGRGRGRGGYNGSFRGGRTASGPATSHEPKEAEST